MMKKMKDEKREKRRKEVEDTIYCCTVCSFKKLKRTDTIIIEILGK